jgi:hypothetical protein
MRRNQYAIWIRWNSGAQDKFELTVWEYGRIGARGLHSERLDCADGSTLFIDRSKVNSFKLFCKEVSFNPMNDDSHYDNPTN